MINSNQFGGRLRNKTVLVTGSGGLIGSEAARHFLKNGNFVVGIDNDMRSKFFGAMGSVIDTIQSLSEDKNYKHMYYDLRDDTKVKKVMLDLRPNVIIHCAAQPSHDWAKSDPMMDFNVNATSTMRLLHYAHKFITDEFTFIHMSTNKVYGDSPNELKFIENDVRYDLAGPYEDGIDEEQRIDRTLHSLFGASKLAGDIVAQEFGKYFGRNVGIFRGGCLTGPQHAGVELHGFLSYIIKCAMHDKKYKIFGYKGKQVRDQIHSADVISIFEEFIANPKKGEVYNIGGQRQNSASILEVIDMVYANTGKKLNYELTDEARVGDHRVYYSDMSKFKRDYPKWTPQYSLHDIVKEMIEKEIERGAKA